MGKAYSSHFFAYPNKPSVSRTAVMVFKNRVGFNDRDLLVIEIVNNIVLSRFPALAVKHKASVLRSQFRVNQNKFRSILIGKDGSIKFDRSIPMDPCYLFGLIDSIPMRRQKIYNNSEFVGCTE